MRVAFVVLVEGRERLESVSQSVRPARDPHFVPTFVRFICAELLEEEIDSLPELDALACASEPLSVSGSGDGVLVAH